MTGNKKTKYDREYYLKNRAKRLEQAKQHYRSKHDLYCARSRQYSRLKLTGFTQEDWDSRFIEQDGLCAICRVNSAMAADHNHETGQKRGLLCRRCNTVLGHIEGPLYSCYLAYLQEWN